MNLTTRYHRKLMWHDVEIFRCFDRAQTFKTKAFQRFFGAPEVMDMERSVGVSVTLGGHVRPEEIKYIQLEYDKLVIPSTEAEDIVLTDVCVVWKTIKDGRINIEMTCMLCEIHTREEMKA